MNIVINSRPLFFTRQNSLKVFIEECFIQITAGNPDHHFIFITDEVLSGRLASSANVKIILPESKKTSVLLQKLWYDYTLPSLLRKNKADVLINVYGACSLRTRIKQYSIINDLAFEQYPLLFPKRQLRFLQQRIPASLLKAKKVFTTTDSTKKKLAEKYKTEEGKIAVLSTGVNKKFQPIHWKEKESILEKYTEGKEYFLFAGEIQPGSNLVNLLKAFSFFKKRQKSNMQLLLALQPVPESDPFIKSIQSYKYRDDVKIINGPATEELIHLAGAAYAFVSPVLWYNPGIILPEIMQCAIPVIVSNTPDFKEICADAALYVDPENTEDIAEKMMLLFKDESRRNEYIKKGIAQSGKFNWDKPAWMLWQSILTSANQ